MHQPIHVIIVDDEEAPRKDLAARINKHFPQLRIVEECSSGNDALIAIARHSPQLIFLDVEMPNMSGFELLESLREIRFSVIFTTSHAAHAVKAFRVAAVDFLLKPYSLEDLEISVSRFLQKTKEQSGNQENVSLLLQNLQNKEQVKIALPTHNGYVFITTPEVVRIESQNTYTTFFLLDKKQVVVSRTMKECEEMITDYGFVRVHQSHMINLAHIQRYIRGEGGNIEMVDGSKVEVSRRKKEEFLEALKRL